MGAIRSTESDRIRESGFGWSVTGIAGAAHTIEGALKLTQRNKIRRAPVVDGDRLVGIVSLGDLLARSSTHDARRERALRPEILVQTLVAIAASQRRGGA